MPSKATATINLKALRHNFQQVKALAPTSKLMAVIKADGYGHGIVEMARAFQRADGFAVARIDEAQTLRHSGIDGRILLLSSALDIETIEYCAQQRIDIVIHNSEAVSLVVGNVWSSPLKLWLKYDSGMHRLGFDDVGLAVASATLADCKSVDQLYYMSHFNSADDIDEHYSRQQIRQFQAAIGNLPAAPVSLANSAAIIRQLAPDSDWVRPGIMLYGANPLALAIQSQYPVELQPVMTLSAPVIAIHHIAAGEAVGYNRRWTAARDSTIATVGIGYGDGYPRHAANGTPVLIKHQRAVLVGAVSMDMITVDITECHDIHIGDTVTLWGEQLLAEEIAECASTISYELFTSISQRVPRLYIN